MMANASFIAKTAAMLSDRGNVATVRWGADGSTIIVDKVCDWLCACCVRPWRWHGSLFCVARVLLYALLCLCDAGVAAERRTCA
jgi:hypothetical protein